MTHQVGSLQLTDAESWPSCWSGTTLPPLPRIAVLVFREGARQRCRKKVRSAGLQPRGSQALRDGSDRVAGEETISKKTSTAALASFRQGPLPTQRRAPRHPLQGVCRDHLTRRVHTQSTEEDVMNASTGQFPNTNFTKILAAILRITFSLLLWTFGASAMDIRVAHVQPKEHRIVLNFFPDRSRQSRSASAVGERRTRSLVPRPAIGRRRDP